jgi:hypothetical protein
MRYKCNKFRSRFYKNLKILKLAKINSSKSLSKAFLNCFEIFLFATISTLIQNKIKKLIHIFYLVFGFGFHCFLTIFNELKSNSFVAITYTYSK